MVKTKNKQTSQTSYTVSTVKHCGSGVMIWAMVPGTLVITWPQLNEAICPKAKAWPKRSHAQQVQIPT